MEGLYTKLRSMGIKFKEYCHKPIPTSKEAVNNLPPELFDGFLKNLCLRDSSKRAYLVSTLCETKIDIKNLSKILNAPKLRFAEPDYLSNSLGTIPGSLSPLSLMNDKNNEVQMVFDEAIRDKVEIVVHPFRCDRSIKLLMSDMIKFLSDCGHDPIFVNVMSKPIEKANDDGNSGLGITFKKGENFADWYTQVITRGDLIEYYDVSGCYILRPNSYFIWENFQSFFNDYLKKYNVENCYFPLFVTKEKLEAEKNHLEGFSPEVAWVTKSGSSDLVEPIALRPSSETIMYSYYSKWIRSYRNLPLKLNQWNSVVRWEFKQPTPFIRSREFLWQEGHTAHRNESEAMEMVYKMLEVYREYYEDVLSVPVIKGIKSEGEKFSGADVTSTIEAFIQESGRGIQAATSHYLGLNFSKIFDICYEDESLTRQYCHQTSWGFTTRAIGIMIMIHGDDKGLVLPPKIAKIQVVLVPILSSKVNEVLEMAKNVHLKLKDHFRCELDDRENYTPGWKFNDWEMRGVPLRLEIGPRDLESKSVRVVHRDNGYKENVHMDGLVESIKERLDSIQSRLYNRAKEKLDASIVRVYEFKDVVPNILNNKLVMVPWSEDLDSEEIIKKKVQELMAEKSNLGGIKPLCIPLEQDDMPEDTKCFFTNKPAKRWVIWGRSY